MKILVNCLAIIALILVVQLIIEVAQTGMEWRRYAPAKLVKIERPAPEADYERLTKLFKMHNGNLASKEDRIVRWKDTKMFRMFEFEHHTVVIFPYNWKTKRFHLIIFAGRVKNYDNLFKSVHFEYRPNPEENTYYFNSTMAFDPMAPSVNQIGFEGFMLGDTRETVINKQMPRIEKKWKNNAEQKQIRVSSLTAGKDIGGGTADKTEFSIFFENDRVVYMSFNIYGFPKLGEYSINHPQLAVIDQGEIKIGE